VKAPGMPVFAEGLKVRAAQRCNDKKSHQMTIFAVSGGIILWGAAVPTETNLPSCRTFRAFHNA